MIFLTVGHQCPFDRLVKLVDEWAGRHPEHRVVAQIGAGTYVPEHVDWKRWLSPQEFEATLEQCTAVVAHAGTGTIIQVLLRSKPLLVLPRLASLGETRNDHQVGTARHFAGQKYVLAAFSDAELTEHLDLVRFHRPRSGVGQEASPQLIARLRGFLTGEPSGQPVTQSQ